MKKVTKLLAVPALLLSLASCTVNINIPTETSTVTSTSEPTPTTTSTTSKAVYGKDTEVHINSPYTTTISDYSSYENTDSYKRVTTAKEFLDALQEAKFEYTTVPTAIVGEAGYKIRDNVRNSQKNWEAAITKGLYLKEADGTYTQIPSDTPWNENDEVYTKDKKYYEDNDTTQVSIKQTLTKEGTVRVIEIAADLDLGYNLIKDLGASTSTYENWDKSNRLKGDTDVYTDPDMKAAGISKIKVENTSNLVIYSKNGSKLKHCGFAVTSCYNVTFRNLDMDEIWMWEDSTWDGSNYKSPTIKVGDYDSFGWAYFKVSFSEGIWIDHCTFGKSFDGQIDYSNPYYTSMGTYYRAPIGATGSNGLNVTYCDFKAGSDDHDGYLYKMMKKIDDEYEIYAANKSGYTYSNKSCRYYFTLRDKGLTFDDILYGIAIPQKKAFLWGDSSDYYSYNKYLQATLSNCTLKNIEDRIPKVRGGIAYVYNVLVDNTEYFSHLSTIKSVQSAVQSANTKYKLGAVSQGILAGLDASVYLESVEYKGISSYLKNNDSAATNKGYTTVNGGYMIKNSILGNAKGSSSDATNPFSSLVTGSLTTSAFSFKVNGEKSNITNPPFTINAYDVIGNGGLAGYFATHKTGVTTGL